MTNALSKIKQEKISFHRTPPKKETKLSSGGGDHISKLDLKLAEYARTKKDLNPEIKCIFEDAFLLSQTMEAAGMLLNSAEKDRPHLNNIVKQYQCDYVLLKSKGILPKEKLEMMTFNVWWQARGRK